MSHTLSIFTFLECYCRQYVLWYQLHFSLLKFLNLGVIALEMTMCQNALMFEKWSAADCLLVGLWAALSSRISLFVEIICIDQDNSFSHLLWFCNANISTIPANSMRSLPVFSHMYTLLIPTSTCRAMVEQPSSSHHRAPVEQPLSNRRATIEQSSSNCSTVARQLLDGCSMVLDSCSMAARRVLDGGCSTVARQVLGKCSLGLVV